MYDSIPALVCGNKFMLKVASIVAVLNTQVGKLYSEEILQDKFINSGCGNDPNDNVSLAGYQKLHIPSSIHFSS